MSNPEVMTYIPFAMNGEKNILQVYRQSGQDEEDATLSEGWPKITMLPESSGGIAPKGLDMNGALYQLYVDTVHRQKGKQIQYDATYATNIGGYSKGAILQSTDLTKSYISTVDNNLTDPDSSASSGWNVYAQTPTATSTTTGTVKIADNLTSTATDTALTANQGRILANMLSGIQGGSGCQWVGSTLIQWGNSSGANGDFISFYKNFPNSFFGLTISDNAFNSSSGYDKSKSNNTGFTLSTGANKLTFFYIAIGN